MQVIETADYANVNIRSKFKVGDSVYNSNDTQTKFIDMIIIKIIFTEEFGKYQFKYLCELKNMERFIFPENYLDNYLTKR